MVSLTKLGWLILAAAACATGCETVSVTPDSDDVQLDVAFSCSTAQALPAELHDRLAVGDTGGLLGSSRCETSTG